MIALHDLLCKSWSIRLCVTARTYSIQSRVSSLIQPRDTFAASAMCRILFGERCPLGAAQWWPREGVQRAWRPVHHAPCPLLRARQFVAAYLRSVVQHPPKKSGEPYCGPPAALAVAAPMHQATVAALPALA